MGKDGPKWHGNQIFAEVIVIRCTIFSAGCGSWLHTPEAFPVQVAWVVTGWREPLIDTLKKLEFSDGVRVFIGCCYILFKTSL